MDQNNVDTNAKNHLQQDIMGRLEAEAPSSQPEAANIQNARLSATSFSSTEHRRFLENAAAWQAVLQQNILANGFPFAAPLADRAGRENGGQIGPTRPPLDFLGAGAFPHDQQNGSSFSSEGSSHSAASSGTNASGTDAEAANEEPAAAVNPYHENNQWTYEEQFKQLYEMGDEPDRKEFLDGLFQFMQRKGSPVNRIPIMAKQTLDIYRLFKLVVAKGGLVEVINKKLWRDITQGLSLPSSITSAAFTLRSQYMKYLYDYECEKYGFSNRFELNLAVDGNRREGRRPGYNSDPNSSYSSLPNGAANQQQMNMSKAQFLASYLLFDPSFLALQGRNQVPVTANPAQMAPNGGNMNFLAGHGLPNHGYNGNGRPGVGTNLTSTPVFKPPNQVLLNMETPWQPPNLKRPRENELPSPPERRSRRDVERREERSSTESDQPENNVVSVQPTTQSTGANNAPPAAQSDSDDDNRRAEEETNGGKQPFQVSMRIAGRIYEGLLYPQPENKDQDNPSKDCDRI